MSKTLLIVDGHSLAFRAFFALPVENFTSAGGQATNAIYGFVSMLVKLMETEQPSHVAVAFDLSRVSFRTEEYPEYKGTREETPPDFVGQVDVIQELLTSMGIQSLTKENYEADDILATLAREGAEAGYRVLVASGDRDTFQLINDKVTVLYPGRSASDLNYMTPASIEERYGVRPEQYPEIAAIVGETSDNLPGVPGVGPKTAAQWINKFGSLGALLDQMDQIGGKRGEALREHRLDVERNRRLNRLVDDLDLPVEVDDLVRGEADYRALQQTFDTLDFTGLRERVYKALRVDRVEIASDTVAAPGPQITLDHLDLVDESFDLQGWFEAHINEPIALAYEGNGQAYVADVVEIAFFAEGQAIVVDTATLTPAQERAIGDFLRSSPKLTVHGGKACAHALASRGWHLPEPVFDTELAAYLCRPDRRGYEIESLAEEYLGETLPEREAPALFSVQAEGNNLAERAVIVARLVEPLRARLQAQAMESLLDDMEIPLQAVLTQMEEDGIAMDASVLDELSTELSAGAHRAETDAYEAIGHTANLHSPKQLQTILFEELDMPKTRKTKTGWTTDAEALSELYSKTEHPFLEALLRYRDNTKIGQMVTGLLNEIRPDGRIHTTFRQTVTATGRIASSDPNLQNIPARSETGLRVRGAFVAGTGYETLMSVDYSQIEMRIMAHLSEDQDLIDAFNSGEDLHKTMAAKVFGVPVEEVDHTLRNRIKATSYGLAYGLSPYGLSKQLAIPVEEAKTLHSQYFQRFGGIGRYLHEVVEEARSTGYTETIFGRRRYFPDLRSDNRRIAEMASRAALNAPIQGSAADIIKIATVSVARRLKEGGYQSRILLQIHDELVLEIAPGEREEVEALVVETMATPVQMSVPLAVSVGVGRSWKEAAH